MVMFDRKIIQLKAFIGLEKALEFYCSTLTLVIDGHGRAQPPPAGRPGRGRHRGGGARRRRVRHGGGRHRRVVRRGATGGGTDAGGAAKQQATEEKGELVGSFDKNLDILFLKNRGNKIKFEVF